MPRLRKRDIRDRDALAPSPPFRHSSISRPVTRNSSPIPLSAISVPGTNMPSSISEPSLKRKHRHRNSTLTATLVRERSSAPITTVKFRAEGRYRSRLQRILSTPPLNTTNSQNQGASSGLEEEDTMKESGFTPTSARESTPYPTTTEGPTSSTIICGSPKPQHTPTTSRDDANDEDEDSEDSQPPRRRTRSTPRRMPPRKKAAVEASPIRSPSYSPLPLPGRTNGGGGGGGEPSPKSPKTAAPSQITMDDLRRLKGISGRVKTKPARMLGPMGSMLNSRDGSARTLAMPLTLGNGDKDAEDGSLNGTAKASKVVEKASSASAKTVEAAGVTTNKGRQTCDAAILDLRDLIPVPGQKLPSPSPHAHPLPQQVLPATPLPQVLSSSPVGPLPMDDNHTDGGPAVTDQDRIAHLTALCKQELDNNIRLRGERDAAQRRVRELELEKARLEKEVARLARYRTFVEQTKSNMDGL